EERQAADQREEEDRAVEVQNDFRRTMAGRASTDRLPYRHRNSRSARANDTAPMAASRPASPATARGPAPSIITARTESFSAVSGSARRNGWKKPGNRAVEKKTPDPMNIGSMTRLMSPLTVCVFCARAATRRPRPANATAPSSESATSRTSEPATPTPNASHPK